MLSENLRKLRIINNLTQQALADIFSTTRQNISHLESGYVEPNIEMLKKYCVYFNVNCDELLEIDLPKQRNGFYNKTFK
ncbi:MAG: helix-turn-helix transcriptional regulator [Clostridia bacterium]|nr:helix-turn-helix transcriptional regulator [Clostridia bacterium]